MCIEIYSCLINFSDTNFATLKKKPLEYQGVNCYLADRTGLALFL